MRRGSGREAGKGSERRRGLGKLGGAFKVARELFVGNI
jgi:hypothetical protein